MKTPRTGGRLQLWRGLNFIRLLPILASLWFPGAGRAGDPIHYVGSAVCASCHALQAQVYETSHHRRSLQPAGEAGALLAPFAGETVQSPDSTVTFLTAQGQPTLRTEGPSGSLQDYPVAWAIGVWPLQQVLVPLPDGSWHASDWAWDARPGAEGGQHWFELRVGSRAGARADWHWTGRRMNANFMCLECHVTGYEKNYVPETRRYATRWAEGHVGCEACHGAGSRHVDWAQGHRGSEASQASQAVDKGLLVALKKPSTAVPLPVNRTEVDACARCHAHRSRFADDPGPQAALHDSVVPSLNAPGLYWPDGQMRGEVYNYGSFLQSRMHGQGVTCSHCHDPHSARLRVPGNGVCLQCHAGATYDTPQHHHHALGGTGAQCAACHMPPTLFMGIQPRHDHFIRVPNPAQSQAVDSPDACTQCHVDRPRAWAVQWAQHWYPQLAHRASALALALEGLGRDDVATLARLMQVVAQPQAPAFDRASALQALAPDAGPTWWRRVAPQLKDPEPMVRLAAAGALREADPALQLRWLEPLLRDPVRSVRMQAARELAPMKKEVRDATAMDLALKEYEEAQRFNADVPGSYENLGTLWLDLMLDAGEGTAQAQDAAQRASVALEQAVRMAPASATARLNLADARRVAGREPEAEQLIRAVLRDEPRNAGALHALGLSLLRQQRPGESLAPLRQASELAPANARFAYVYGLALDRMGRGDQARQVLEAAARRHPRNVELMGALLDLARRARDPEAVTRYTVELRARQASR